MRKTILALGAALLAGAASPALAAPASSTFNPGQGNLAEDYSGEIVLRNVGTANAPNLVPVTSGNFQVGDLLVSAFQIEKINLKDVGAGTGINELTGVSVARIMNVTASPFPPFGSPAGSYSVYTLGTATAAEFMAATGATSVSAGTMVQFYEDAGNDFNTSSILGAFASAINGALRVEAGFNGSADEIWKALAPTSFAGFQGTAGTDVGDFFYNLSLINNLWTGFSFSNIAGLDVEFTGSGNLYRPAANSPFPIEDDLKFTFTVQRVPEPATLGLMGLGLLGVGFGRRRKSA